MKQDSPFIKNLIAQCQARPRRVIFPEGEDPRVMQAACDLLDWGATKEVTLITTTSSVQRPTTNTGLKIITSKDSAIISLTKSVCEKSLQRRAKSLENDVLVALSKNPLYQAGALLQQDETDCAVAGCVETTADVIRAALGTIGLAAGITTVSGSFIMDRHVADTHEIYLFADCGVVIDPSIQQLVDIAASSAETLKKVTGRDPVVAFLSFSTKGSAQHPAAQKIQEAARQFKQHHPTIKSDGELQFDAAYDDDIGRRKAPGSPVPGRANCFVFPNLDAGNIAYKITQRLGGFGAYGPILQGLSKPYSDLSRGATAHDIAISALINMTRAD
jgi:phosphate acetyltransferase